MLFPLSLEEPFPQWETWKKNSMSMTDSSLGKIMTLLKGILSYLFPPFQGYSVNWGSLLFLSAPGLSCCTVFPAMALSELRNTFSRTPEYTLFFVHISIICLQICQSLHMSLFLKRSLPWTTLSQGNWHWKMNIWILKSSSSLAIPYSSVAFEYESFWCCIKYLMFFLCWVSHLNFIGIY